jgi:DTW domain-containing protein YfiP
VCYCAHLTTVDTATRIIVLQHPRERDMAIGTARMASLCLPNSELHVGVDWRDKPELRRALSDAARPAMLLYPGRDAIDVLRDPPKGPITLIVIDGTWANTKNVVRDNPELGQLPRLAFTPPMPSQYRIRKEPAAACVSTIEALCYALGAIEGDRARFTSLLAPFRAMIDAQLEFIRRRHGGTRHAKKTSVRRPQLPPGALRARG